MYGQHREDDCFGSGEGVLMGSVQGGNNKMNLEDTTGICAGWTNDRKRAGQAEATRLGCERHHGVLLCVCVSDRE